MELLGSAVDDLDPPSERALDPLSLEATRAVWQRRASQLAFLDGERGTGKTSVELSLRYALTAKDGIGQMAAVPATAPAEVKADIERLRKMAEALEPRLVWLTPLDMEPLPEGTNLLAALLVRLEQVVRAQAPTTPQPGGWLASVERDDALLSTLEALRSDVVKAWDGGLRIRSPGQDLHAWSDEVLTAERARLSLESRLSYLLEKIAAQSPARRSNPLFVLVVDDFDLSPSLCIELLRVVRMVKSPRLFFTFAGDLSLAEHVMFLKSAGSAAGLLASPPLRTVFVDRVREMTQSVASNNLRKLVPPAQRVELRALGADEALAVRIRPGEDHTLDELLSTWSYVSDGRAQTLAEVFHGPGAPDEDADGVHLFADFLAVPIRALVDTWMLLQRAVTDDGTISSTALADVVERETLLRLGETWLALPDDERLAWHEAVVGHTLSSVLSVDLPSRGAFALRAVRQYVYANAPPRWLRARALPERRPLPAAVGAGVALLHDLRVAQGRPSDIALVQAFSRSMGATVHTFEQPRARAGSRADGAVETVIWLQWPALVWDRIGDALLFVLRWSGSEIANHSADPALDWLRLWVQTERGERVLDDSALVAAFEALIERAVDDAAEHGPKRVVGVTHSPQRLAFERVCCAVLMLAPEIAPRDDALGSSLIEALAPLVADDALAAHVRLERARGLKSRAGEGSERLLGLVSPSAWRALWTQAHDVVSGLVSLLGGGRLDERADAARAAAWSKRLLEIRAALDGVVSGWASVADERSTLRVSEAEVDDLIDTVLAVWRDKPVIWLSSATITEGSDSRSSRTE